MLINGYKRGIYVLVITWFWGWFGKNHPRLFNKILKSPERSEGDFKILLNNRGVIFTKSPEKPCDSLLITWLVKSNLRISLQCNVRILQSSCCFHLPVDFTFRVISSSGWFQAPGDFKKIYRGLYGILRFDFTNHVISTSNLMAMRVIWDKSPELFYKTM